MANAWRYRYEITSGSNGAIIARFDSLQLRKEYLTGKRNSCFYWSNDLQKARVYKDKTIAKYISELIRK